MPERQRKKVAARKSAPGRDYDLFAVTAHAVEALCAAELSALGITATTVTGGATWRGDARSLYRANLELRTASRVIARAGEFRARGFPELERHVAKLPWSDFLRHGAAVQLRVTCRKSRLYHEGAVAERVARVLGDSAGVTVREKRADDDDDADRASPEAQVSDGRGRRMSQEPFNDDRRGGMSRDPFNDGAVDATVPAAQLIIVRFLRDVCTVSVDASGALLHQRGYRQALAKAPLRETIAAAMLLGGGWRGDTPLLDPLCGSGTIPIEAALLARSIPPGLARPDLTPRSYAFESWPGFAADVWNDVVESARSRVREAAVPIAGSDRDGGAIAAAKANAQRAGVGDDVDFARATLGAVQPPPGTGHIVTNPPYGVRVGNRRDLHALYAALGSVMRDRLHGWSLTMLAADDGLAAATELPLREVLSTRNGGIPVRLLSTAT